MSIESLDNILRTFHEDYILWYLCQSLDRSKRFVMLSRWRRFYRRWFWGRSRSWLNGFDVEGSEGAAWRWYDGWHSRVARVGHGSGDLVSLTHGEWALWWSIMKSRWELDDSWWSRTHLLRTDLMFLRRSYCWYEDLGECFALKVVKWKRRSESVTGGWSCWSPETVSSTIAGSLERSED